VGEEPTKPAAAGHPVSTLEAELEAALEARFHGPGVSGPRLAALAAELVAEGSPRAVAVAAFAQAAAAFDAQDLAPLTDLVRGAVQRLEDVGDHRWLAAALRLAGATEFGHGRFEAAESLYGASLEAAGRMGEEREAAATLQSMAAMAVVRDEYDRAEHLFAETIAICRRTQDRAALGRALMARSSLHGRLGDLPGVLSTLLEATSIFRSLEHPLWLAMCLGNVAYAHTILGDGEAAFEAASEAVSLAESSAAPLERAVALVQLAGAHRIRGEPEAGLRLALRAYDLHVQVMSHHLGATQVGVAECALAAGDLELAETHAEAALAHAIDHGLKEPRADALEVLARVRLARSAPREALDAAEEGLGFAAATDLRRQAALHGATSRAHRALGNLESALDAADAQRTLLEQLARTDATSQLRHSLHDVDRARAAAAEAARGVTRRVLEAQEEERRHIARELHDDLSQRLALLVVGLEALRENAGDVTPDVAVGIDALHSDLRGVADAVHRVSRRLHPASLERLGLVPAVGSYLRELSELHGLEVGLDVDQLEPRLPRRVELCLFRVVQEALANVVRHAGTREASIELVRTDRGVSLEIRDPGRGFSPDESEPEGIGLAGIHERVDHLGGVVQVESAPGEGTRVAVVIPLDGGP
jgi:signal transduction histidine kinase